MKMGDDGPSQNIKGHRKAIHGAPSNGLFFLFFLPFFEEASDRER
jgi:hypothetical protein